MSALVHAEAACTAHMSHVGAAGRQPGQKLDNTGSAASLASPQGLHMSGSRNVSDAKRQFNKSCRPTTSALQK